MKKVLTVLYAILVSASMLCGMVVTADTGFTKLIDLDMSSYIKDTSSTDPNNVQGPIGNITNNGTLAATTTVKMSSRSGFWACIDLSKGTVNNASHTAYLRRTLTTNICSDGNRFNTVTENALETQENTISFWLNYTPVNQKDTEYGIFSYYTKYKDGDTVTEKSLFNLDQAPTTTGAFRLVGKYQTPNYGNITDVAANKWAHYVVTNPAYSGGSKTMKVYVNGELKGSQTVSQPAGSAEDVKLVFGGEFKGGSYVYWPADFSLGEVTVYSGILEPDEIAAVYDTNKPRYEEEPEALIDLDMSTYIKDTSSTDPNNVQGPIGNITNNGTLAATTTVKMSSRSGFWADIDLNKETMLNETGGITYYLRRTITTNVCRDGNRFNTISENALETQENTIMFWAKYVPVNQSSAQYNLFNYYARYNDGGTVTDNNLLNLDQYPTTSGRYKLVGRDQTPSYGDITDIAAGKWAHYVVTNPAYSGGSKTMRVFVNGKYKGSQTVTKPSGTAEDVKLVFGGEYKSSYICWPTDISLGRVKVLSGVLNDAAIENLYLNEKAAYTAHDDKCSFVLYNGDGEEVGYNISPDEIINGVFDARLTLNNVTDKTLTARLYMAAYKKEALQDIGVESPVVLQPYQIDRTVDYSLNDFFSGVSSGDRISFYIWSDSIAPLMNKKEYRVLGSIYGDDNTYRLVLKMDEAPRASTLKPQNFTATAAGEAIEIERTVYYPFTKELHLILADPPVLSSPYTVRATLSDISGNPININAVAKTLSFGDTPDFQDSIKYVAFTLDGKPVYSIDKDGVYKIEVGTALQGASKSGPVTVKIFKTSNGAMTQIASKQVSFAEDDDLFTVEVPLLAGDEVFASIE